MEDQKFCTSCGAQISSEDKFCEACGKTIDEAQSEKSNKIQPDAQQPIAQRTTTTKIIPKEIDTGKLILGVIGLLCGIVSLFVFPGVIFSGANLYWLIVFPVLAIVGLIISIKSIRSIKAIGIIGLIFNIIALIIQIIWGLILLLTYLYWTP